MHCSRRRLLRRGQEFHVCTKIKSAIGKKSGKLIYWSSYIYIYIYIYLPLSPSLSLSLYIYIYNCIYIYVYHQHHVTLSARIFLAVSCYTSLSSITFGRSSGLHPVSEQRTELLYVGSNWTPCLCSSMWRGPQLYITHEFVPTSPGVSRVSSSSNFDSFCDGWSVAV